MQTYHLNGSKPRIPEPTRESVDVNDCMKTDMHDDPIMMTDIPENTKDGENPMEIENEMNVNFVRLGLGMSVCALPKFSSNNKNVS
jgi:hypothetical protein